jgi:cell division protease FtsH
MGNTVKTLIFWIVISISALLLWQVVKNSNQSTQSVPEISYSQFLSQVDSGNVAKVRIAGSIGQGTYGDRSSFRVIVPAAQEQMLEALRQKQVEVWYADKPDQSLAGWLMNLAPLALLAALWFFMIRQMKSRANARADAVAANSGAPWQGK